MGDERCSTPQEPKERALDDDSIWLRLENGLYGMEYSRDGDSRNTQENGNEQKQQSLQDEKYEDDVDAFLWAAVQ